MTAATRPLAGYRVLDFTHAAAGPYATMWLADLGAEIVKIEKPGRGDGARYMGEPMHGPKHSDYFVALNPDKRSVSINLHTPEGVALARELAAHCDLVIQNFRPGVLDKLGLGFEDLRALRTGLVYCSISAFGAASSWRGRPANDIIMQGVTGLMDITGEPEGDPVRVGVPISDYATGLFGLSGVLAALLVRDAHPDGQHIEVSMFDSTLALMANYIPGVLDLGTPVPRLGRGHPQIVPYQAFRCADDRYVIVGAFTAAFWRRLAAALGHPEWIDDPRFATNTARVENRDVLVPMIEKILAGRTRDDWCAVLETNDVPCTPVNSVQEALDSLQARESATTIEVRDEAQTRSGHVAANPIRSAAWPDARHHTSPHIGEHTEQVLADLLGKTPQDIDALVEAGVVGREETG
ncbi:CaiB/BaiF CoA transferase family protein [Saccharopolyspora phatthalungensis]|uniref:Crotonobetainyl-CoA:carnitine CoA-transferase CaiB-like acyl-CoA transferase n=1 Tax=Saccharopolyspora phatthalungensis TaxID=664693 RepID=A0A840QER4_9PSEU|nr:CaiB/BaiF CoA-transferase family protein [Saccharopolyspora phatthalungensis]MBB5158916.1 crotonobetainyl-CoA:carnitine CoA-transferase CaiB-like acyl-CoA transferase [Saccharopolyspora phatthalungensis]